MSDMIEQNIAAASVIEEPVVPQSKVNAIVASEKERARQKGIEEGMALAQAQNPAQPQPIQPNAPIDKEAIINETLKRVQDNSAEQMRQKQMQEEREAQVKDFVKKVADRLASIKEANPEIEKELQAFGDVTGDDEQMKNLKGSALYLASQYENNVEVLHEIAKDPAKQSQIAMALKTSPQLAMKYVQKISESLMANENAMNAPKAKKPLDTIKGSSVSGNGDPTSVAYHKNRKGYKR